MESCCPATALTVNVALVAVVLNVGTETRPSKLLGPYVWLISAHVRIPPPATGAFHVMS